MQHERPDPKLYPGLAIWMWDERRSPSWVAARLNCSGQHIRCVCRAFGDRRRTIPSEVFMAEVLALTAGRVGAESYYPPQLHRFPVAA